MTKRRLGISLVLLLVPLAPSARAQRSLDGIVRNGTTGGPAAGIEVVLLQLQSGMEAVANAKTDAQGRFHFTHPDVGQRPMLVRAIFRGVNFHQPVPPGHNTAEVEVFEPTRDPGSVQVSSRVVFFQPNGTSLLVGEEFSVLNETKPPAAYFKADGNFEFEIPPGAELQQVAAWGPAGMPVVQGTIDRGANRHAIAFAFRPGHSGVRMSYVLPYPSNQTTVKVVSPYAVARITLASPPTVELKGEGFQPAGSDQGMTLHVRDAVPAGTPIEVAVAGTAPLQSESGAESGEGDTSRAVETMPSRLDGLKWPLLGGFGALFALGAVYLWRRSALQATGPETTPAGTGPRGKRRQKPSAPQADSGPARDLQEEVGASLDSLKDALFRLELRRQAGTLSEEEYSREHARVQKILRDLVKG